MTSHVGFFDFLSGKPRYRGRPGAINRLNWRHRFLVEDIADDLDGSRVLDLASHDGRWSYALSAAGAREVIGIEPRAELITQFDGYPDDEVKKRINLIEGDMFDVLPDLSARGERFDVVAIYGVFYHIMDHYRLLQLVYDITPRLIVVDGEFMTSEQAVVRMFLEGTDSKMNAIEQRPGQQQVPIGVPSRPAMEMMAGSLGYAVSWADWDSVPADQRSGLGHYYRESGRRRGTCVLRSRGGA